MSDLTHFNQRGEAHMVDIASKHSTHRIAIAAGLISMQAETFERVRSGGHKKGDVLGIARIAGIMASKKTADLIPLCHPISLTHVDIEFELNVDNSTIECRAKTETTGQTGVEMEALTAVQVALLTIYDMCKAMDKGMQMGNIRLVHKSGGKSGVFTAD